MKVTVHVTFFEKLFGVRDMKKMPVMNYAKSTREIVLFWVQNTIIMMIFLKCL